MEEKKKFSGLGRVSLQAPATQETREPLLKDLGASAAADRLIMDAIDRINAYWQKFPGLSEKLGNLGFLTCGRRIGEIALALEIDRRGLEIDRLAMTKAPVEKIDQVVLAWEDAIKKLIARLAAAPPQGELF